MTNSPAVCCGACCTRLENVGVSFGKKEILEKIDLHVHCGQLAVIIGPNGAGKTTLLRAILGEVPHSGIIHNCLSSSKNGRKLTIGYVPQKLDFDATSPVSVVDLFSASLSQRPVWLGNSGATKKQAKLALELVEAEHLLKSRLGTLSGGQLQRVLLALALTPEPDLLLLDEPSSGIDPAGIELFYRMVSDLRCKHHLAILMASHDCMVAARYADRMLFLNHSILCDGDPIKVLTSEIVINAFGRIPLPETQFPPHKTHLCNFTGKEV
ncbi:MAG TPA: ABC transporter ATP-binding protein [Fibrobacteres bacterium]|nr:ABC transporter ATP-binding protein [Fibrobacterota bacterium]